MLATTGMPCCLAWRTRARCPSCRLPIVGTKAQACGAGERLAQVGNRVDDLHRVRVESP